MDDLDRLYHRLLDAVRESAPHLRERRFRLGDIPQHLLPYRLHRRDMGFDSVQQYEGALARLAAGERGYLSADAAVQQAFRRAVDGGDVPLEQALRLHGDALVALTPEARHRPDTPSAAAAAVAPRGRCAGGRARRRVVPSVCCRAELGRRRAARDPDRAGRRRRGAGVGGTGRGVGGRAPGDSAHADHRDSRPSSRCAVVGTPTGRRHVGGDGTCPSPATPPPVAASPAAGRPAAREGSTPSTAETMPFPCAPPTPRRGRAGAGTAGARCPATAA
jgi:hypothetical protein